MDLLTIIILNSLFIWGAYVAFQYEYSAVDQKVTDANVLGYVAYWLDGFISDFWRKPLYGCPACMSTVWTPIVLSLIFQLEFSFDYFIAWIGTAGLNYLIGKKIG